MMTERHYDDEALISLIETGRTASDAHLPSCKTCSVKLESFRDLSDVLHDASVWDRKLLNEDPVPSTIANLRAFADRMTAEDTRAEAYLADLLAGPREEWMPRLQQHPEYRTAGVVRKLIAASDRAIDTMPPDAVEISRLATEVADHLDPAAYPSDTVARLRGAAWRDRGYVLFYTGQFTEALNAVDRAEAAFATCAVDEYERARVSIVRALVFRSTDRMEGSLINAANAATSFARFGDIQKVVSSRLAETYTLFKAKQFEDALCILRDLLEKHENEIDDATRARVSMHVAACLQELGRNLEALRELEVTAALYDALGMTAEGPRVRWNVALILFVEGRRDEAEARMQSVVREFDSLQMMSASAVARLHLAEMYLETGRLSDVQEICRYLMKTFANAGLSYSPRALTALAFLKEAVDRGALSKKHVVHVREYVAALPRQENLLFAPLPD